MLGLGLGLTHFGTRGGVSDTPDSSVSGAALMLASEPEGFAIDFSDASICIKDLTTPANSFASQGTALNGALAGPGGKLTYTSPSPKLCRQQNGLYAYQAHNLYLNSAAPANQAITVVSGATYAVTITGTASVTASGAATGTWTAGTTTFTAATGTLTLGSTSGAGTVHVRRTPSVSDYVGTIGAAKYSLPYEWDASGNPLGILAEEGRTNLCLYDSDLTKAAWTKSNLTAAKTATGPDGIANSASTLTASAANGTCLQSITSASAARITSCFIKRRTGSGAIEMTQNNGSTWTAVTVTAEWTRVNIDAATLANPTVGFRIVTSGDAVDVAFVQHEVGAFVTSPIEAFGSSVTRAGDLLSFSGITISQQAATLFGEGASAGGAAMLLELSAATRSNALTSIYYESFGTSLRTLTSGASFAIQAVLYNAVTGGTRNKIASRAADNDFHCAVNGYLNGTPDTAGNFAASTLTTFGIGSNASGEQLNGHLRRIMYLPRAMSDAELQALTA